MVYKGRLKKSQTWDIVPNSVPTPPEDRVSLRGNFLAGFLRLVKDAFRIKNKSEMHYRSESLLSFYYIQYITQESI